MRTRASLGPVLILFLAPALSAQTPQPAPFLPSNEPNANALYADRVRFVREIYALDAAAMDKLVKDLSALVPFQEKYRNETSKTVSRIELAITLTMNDGNIAAAEKPNRLARFQDQLNGIHGRAPLSLASVIKMADAGLPPDKVKAAHDKIAARLSGRLQGAPFNVAKVDGLLLPPASPGKRPDLAASLAQSNPPSNQPQTVYTKVTPTPATPDAKNPAKAGSPPPPAPQPKPAFVPPTPPPTAPPPPPREIPPAPPESEWSGFVDKSAAKYAFTPDQKKVADKIFAQCKSRAGEHREKSKSDYDSAAKLSDAKAKTEKTAELNKPLDRLYDELVQRLQSVATAEQKAKVEKAAPPPAKPALPSKQ